MTSTVLGNLLYMAMCVCVCHCKSLPFPSSLSLSTLSLLFTQTKRRVLCRTFTAQVAALMWCFRKDPGRFKQHIFICEAKQGNLRNALLALVFLLLARPPRKGDTPPTKPAHHTAPRRGTGRAGRTPPPRPRHKAPQPGARSPGRRMVGDFYGVKPWLQESEGFGANSHLWGWWVLLFSQHGITRCSSREDRNKGTLLSVVYFSRGILPPKSWHKLALPGDLGNYPWDRDLLGLSGTSPGQSDAAGPAGALAWTFRMKTETKRKAVFSSWGELRTNCWTAPNSSLGHHACVCLLCFLGGGGVGGVHLGHTPLSQTSQPNAVRVLGGQLSVIQLLNGEVTRREHKPTIVEVSFLKTPPPPKMVGVPCFPSKPSQKEGVVCAPYPQRIARNPGAGHGLQSETTKSKRHMPTRPLSETSRSPVSLTRVFTLSGLPLAFQLPPRAGRWAKRNVTGAKA